MKKKVYLKALTLCLAAVMLLGCFAGCASSSGTPAPTKAPADSPDSQGTAQNTEQNNEPSTTEELNLPTTPQVIGTHGSSTWFYIVGSGFASVVSDHSPMRVMAQPYAGPSAWMPDLESGAISFGVINYTDAAWTYLATVEGVPTTTKIRQVLRGNQATNIAWITRDDSDIKSLSDLKGKTVAGVYSGTLNSLALLTAELASVGLTWDDVNVVPVPDVNTGVQLLGDGTVDACHGGTATSANVVELNQRVKLRILPFGNLTPEELEADGISDEFQAILDKHVPGTSIAVQEPVGIQDERKVVYTYPMMLASSTNISDDVVYCLLKTAYENNAELVAIDNWLTNWTSENMFDPSFVIPYHDGAIRFYKEIGLWDDAAQARQDELLAKMGES